MEKKVDERLNLLEIVTDRGRYKVEETPAWESDCDACNFIQCRGLCPMRGFANEIATHLVLVERFNNQ